MVSHHNPVGGRVPSAASHSQERSPIFRRRLAHGRLAAKLTAVAVLAPLLLSPAPNLAQADPTPDQPVAAAKQPAFTDEQVSNGSIVRELAVAAGASDRALLAAFEAGFVEGNFSSNPPPGCSHDHDSAGLYQQRQGWVPENEKPGKDGWCVPGKDPRLNPRWAAHAFIHGTAGNKGVLYWDKVGEDSNGKPIKTAGNLAQATQNSEYPEKYDKRESDAKALLAKVAQPEVEQPEVEQPFTPTANQAFVVGASEHVFYRGPKGTLKHTYWSGSKKKVISADWGGKLEGQPVAFWNGTTEHVFGRTPDGRLQHWYWQSKDPTKIKKSFWTGSKQVTSDPAGFFVGASQHVFYRGPKGTLKHTYWSGSKKKVISADWGGKLEGQPVAFWNGTTEHVFGRTPDGRLQHWYWQSKDPTKIKKSFWTGSKQVTSDPAGFFVGASQHVFYRGPKGTLKHTYWSGSKKKVISADWGGKLEGQPVAFWNGTTEHVFGRTPDGRLQHWYWQSKDPTKIKKSFWTGSKQVTSDPAGFFAGASQHVFYRGPKGTLKHTYWSGSKKKVISADWGDGSSNESSDDEISYLAKDDYPYRNPDPDKSDEWLFFQGECTSFVAWAIMSRVKVPFDNRYKDGKRWGDAKEWISAADRTKVPVYDKPKAGDAAVRVGGKSGHVAFVTKVNANGTFEVDEYNYKGGSEYSHRTVSVGSADSQFSKFIRFK